ncbi:MAG TPA: hypothetical protein VFJ02_00930 [Vicinamibacterales bacterium]|nr:hypothetical protein [Vicinamibacterales bacterium]
MERLRRRTLQESLDALIEARQLRERIERVVVAHRMATRMMLGAHRRRRINDLSRAYRVF